MVTHLEAAFARRGKRAEAGTMSIHSVVVDGPLALRMQRPNATPEGAAGRPDTDGSPLAACLAGGYEDIGRADSAQCVGCHALSENHGTGNAGSAFTCALKLDKSTCCKKLHSRK
jgi:hypothetical protein